MDNRVLRIGALALVGWFAVLLAPAQQKVTLAVGDFENKTPLPHSEVASFTDMITTAIVKVRKFEVLERDRIAEVLKEQGMGEAELMSPKTAQKFGELTGADFILVGTLTEARIDKKEVGGKGFSVGRAVARLCVDIRIIDAKTGSIKIAETLRKEKKGGVGLGSDKVSFAGSDSGIFGQVARECADEVVALTCQTIFPIRIIALNEDEVTLNYGSGTLKPDELYDVFVQGEELKDPDTGEVLGRTETKIGRITITSVEAKLSKAKITEGQDKVAKDMICRKVREAEQKQEDKKDKGKKKLPW